MNTIDAIKNRHSYRGKYTGAKVPREDLVTILEAGLMAPPKKSFEERAWFNSFNGK
ncbi:nitroreductase family protein [Pseudobutyrivibrio sp. C4]|uniref:nitroreductase family protein n=1 Tax=Pseudobutyrivibrio sp. C4 TaxID=1520803 RepID=UPI000B824C45|nr:nitroreductase family protein [Pseudobutyrivibrio sp. C4]